MGAVRREVSLGAPAREVWDRCVTFEGINDEFAPLLRMTMPRGMEGRTIADVEPGVPIGRSWLLLGGVVPVDWDDLVLVEIEPPRRFREDSSMATMTRWGHERVIDPTGEGTCVLSDSLDFELRRPLRWIPGADKLACAIVGWLFDRRHARLRLAHGAGPATPNVRRGSP